MHWHPAHVHIKKITKPWILLNLLDHIEMLGFDNDSVNVCMSICNLQDGHQTFTLESNKFSKFALHDDDFAYYNFYFMHYMYLSVVNQSC